MRPRASEWLALRQLWSRYRLSASTSRRAITTSGRRRRVPIYNKQTGTTGVLRLQLPKRAFHRARQQPGPGLKRHPARRANAVSGARFGAKSRPRSQVCFLPQASLAHPREVSERPLRLSSTDHEVRRALRCEWSRAPIRSRTRAGWRHVYRSAQFGGQTERPGIRRRAGFTATLQLR